MNPNNQLSFLKWLGQQLNLDTLSDGKGLEAWYKVSIQTVIDNGGSGLLHANGGSLYAVLKQLYPTHHWQPWKFVRTPKGMWENIAVRRYAQELL